MTYHFSMIATIPARYRSPLSVGRSAEIRFTAVSILLSMSLISAQTSDYSPQMTFDVVSIRETKSADIRKTPHGSFEPVNSSHLTGNSWSFRTFLVWAYDIDDQRLIGLDRLPLDLEHTTFDVQAKSDAVADEKLATLTERQRKLGQMHMLQAMLAERFNLRSHWENRDSRTYDLVVSRPGKLRTTGTPPSAGEITRWGGRAVPKLYEWGDDNHVEFIAHGTTAGDIAEELSARLGTLVRDKTGLIGQYDFDFTYTAHQAGSSDRDFNDDNPWPAFEVAIHNELGLRLAPSRGSVPFLVIDHAEMPSEN